MSARPDVEAECVAQEWQRDGRGLWAMRFCQREPGHSAPHYFGVWNYNVEPPAPAASVEAHHILVELVEAHSGVIALDAHCPEWDAAFARYETAIDAAHAYHLSALQRARETDQ